jgi:hypothetical protein
LGRRGDRWIGTHHGRRGGGPLRRRLGCRDHADGRFGAQTSTFGPNASSDQHTAQEDDDRHNRGGHEQEDQLFAVQLDLMERVVLGVRGQNCSDSSTPFASVPALGSRASSRQSRRLARARLAVEPRNLNDARGLAGAATRNDLGLRIDIEQRHQTRERGGVEPTEWLGRALAHAAEE